MKKEYLIIATIALAVLILASSVPAMQTTFISEHQPICPEESYNKITELYEEGLSEEEIAEELAFPLDIVTEFLKGDYTPPPCPEPNQTISPSECPAYGKIKDLYGEGWSEEEIAETLEFPLDVVRGFLSGNYTIISACPEPYQKSEKNVTPEVTYDGSSLVTIETPYGQVRVPQDVLEREGKEKIIAKCSEAMKRRVITPPVKKVPEVTYVTIETPYGPLQVPKDFLESEGKEKIIATHVEFMKQLEELKRMEEQMRESNKKSSDYRMIQCHTANASDTKDVPSDKWANFIGEWAFFFRREVHSEPDLLYGKLDPHPLYNAGESFFSYQEREIYLNNDNDTIEFISNHLDTGQRDVWVALYDNTSEYPVSSFQLNFTDVDAPIEYYLIINSAEKKYDLWLKNTGTGDLRYRGYYDSDDPSDYIIHYTGSTELYYDLLDNEFRVLTDIKDDWTRIGSTWYRPNEIFYFCCYSDEKPYVEVTASWDTNNFTYTSHETKYEGEDSYEPDNSFDQYSTMSVTSSLQSQSRSIAPAGDNDYIRFYAQAGKKYIFYTESSIDTYGYLYDSNQNQLTYDDDSGSDYNFRIEYGDIETSGYYFLRVRGYSSSTKGPYTLYYKYETPSGGDLITSKSGTLSGSGSTYTFSVSGYSTVTAVMAGNENADFDLYAKWGSPPTTSNYDARGYSGTSLEYFTTSGSGTLYIMVRSWSGSGNWKCWALSGSPGANSGRKTGSLSGSGSTATYSLSGSGKGYAFNSGPDGSDFDLYTKWNSQPTTSSYDARGYSGWAQEIAGPASGSGTLYFMVRSWSGSGQYATVELIF